jgi:hypothetical protein
MEPTHIVLLYTMRQQERQLLSQQALHRYTVTDQAVLVNITLIIKRVH